MILVKVKVAQSCPTRCNPIDYTVSGILQARILEREAFPSSRGSNPKSPILQADSLPAEPQEKPAKVDIYIQKNKIGPSPYIKSNN